jgi:hypothetical protein
MRVAKRNEYRIRHHVIKRKRLRAIAREVRLRSPWTREETDVIERFLRKLWRRM